MSIIIIYYFFHSRLECYVHADSGHANHNDVQRNSTGIVLHEYKEEKENKVEEREREGGREGERSNVKERKKSKKKRARRGREEESTAELPGIVIDILCSRRPWFNPAYSLN